MPPPPDMGYWLGQKYAILGKQAEGEYQRNIAQAGLTSAQAGQVAADAPSRRALEAAETGKVGEEAKQVSPNAASQRELQSSEAFRARAGGQYELEGAETERTNRFLGPMGAAQYGDIQNQMRMRQGLPPLWSNQPGQGAPTSSSILDVNRPLQNITPRMNPNPPVPSYNNPDQFQTGTADVQPFRKGAANVKPGSKAGKAGGPPKGLEAMLPMLLAAMQGGGGGGGGPSAGLPMGAPPARGGPPAPGMRKGSANVKAPGGKGGKGGGKAGPKGGGGLEAILPNLLAASQTSQMGGGAAGPQAAGPSPLMAPGAAAPATPPPGFAVGMADVLSGQSAPGYPFGAGYLFGVTAVPGQGSGTVDKVPAMLAPHEAVLNKAAADMMGRGRIAALNAAGAKQMGLRRGAA